MKILVFSDTHGDLKLVKRAIEAHPQIDTVLFAGDYARDMNSLLDKGLTIYRVKGNCDKDDDFDEELVFDIEGVRFLLCHGHMYSVKYQLNDLATRAEEAGAAAAVFGHTHKSCCTSSGGILLFNPGCAGSKTRGNQPSYGIIEIKGGDITQAKIRSAGEN